MAAVEGKDGQKVEHGPADARPLYEIEDARHGRSRLRRKRPARHRREQAEAEARDRPGDREHHLLPRRGPLLQPRIRDAAETFQTDFGSATERAANEGVAELVHQHADEHHRDVSKEQRHGVARAQ